MDLLICAAGLVILILAGDALVKGAVNLSLRAGLPVLLVGLTVVAFGTSAPELLVAISAVMSGLPALALGNVVGSNIANVLLVIGLPAIVAGMAAGGDGTERSFVIMMGASVAFVLLAFLGPFGIAHGAVLLLLLGAFLYDGYRSARAHRAAEAAAALSAPEEELEGADPGAPLWRVLAFLAAGIVGLPIGADLFVDGATRIAERLGVSEVVIGLTLVAIGTSLPELATTVMAAIRREADVAIGNVIGSNIFNLLAIVGITSFVGQIPVAAEFLTRDLWVMLAASALLAPFVLRRARISRLWGAVFLGLYVGYLLLLTI